MTVERWWNGTDRGELLAEKPVIVPLGAPQITHRLTLDRNKDFAVDSQATDRLSQNDVGFYI
jgi:hypothetical protein